MKILISTWGLPAEWREVDYEYKNNKSKDCTTLSIISKEYDKVFVLALESIFDYDINKNSNNNSKCGECYRKCKINYESNNNYEEFIHNGENSILEMIKCLEIDIPGSKVKAILLPAIGHPGYKKDFIGDVRNYISIGLIRLYKEITEIAEKNRIDEICLDTSHGINFMPALSLDMVTKLAQLIYLIQGEDEKNQGITLRAINADPLTKGSENKPLKINVYKNELIDRLNINLERDRDLYPKGDDEIHAIYELAHEVLASTYYPFPLLLYYFSIDQKVTKIENIIDSEILDSWYKESEIEENLIRHSGTVGPKFVNDILMASSIINKINNMSKNREISVNILNDINEQIYHRVSDVNYYLIKHELSNINQRKIDFNKNVTDPDKRIMIAHAGFQEGILTKELKYNKDPHEIIKKILGKGKY